MHHAFAIITNPTANHEWSYYIDSVVGNNSAAAILADITISFALLFHS